MTAEAATNAVLLLSMGIDLWGIFNSVILMQWLWKARKHAAVISTLFDSAGLMALNATCWFLMLAQAFIWPVEQTTELPPMRAAVNILLFLGASTSISFALHRMRTLMTKSSAPDPREKLLRE